jgi:hypothetical protein
MCVKSACFNYLTLNLLILYHFIKNNIIILNVNIYNYDARPRSFEHHINAALGGWMSTGITPRRKMSAPSKANINQLDNPTRTKANHQSGTNPSV